MKVVLEIDPHDPRDVEAAERMLRRLQSADATAPAAPMPRPKKPRGPTRVLPPTPGEMAQVTELDHARTAAMAERKGMLKP